MKADKIQTKQLNSLNFYIGVYRRLSAVNSCFDF